MDSTSRLRVLAVGLRGIPNVPGGVEAHSEKLYPLLTQLGAEVEVFGREPFRPDDSPEEWREVGITWTWAPRAPGLEALLHTLFTVLRAAVHRPDVLHIHAIGPAIFTPLARLLGLRVVVTHHGQDYMREKWGWFARLVLRAGERLGMMFANERIVVSSALQQFVEEKYGVRATMIPNGVADPPPITTGSLLARYGLKRHRYVIQVSRVVPEKRQLDLIEAFERAALPGWKLVLVGGAQGNQQFSDAVLERAAWSSNVVCTGFLVPDIAQDLLRHAGIFVLPSSHEGLPIALLEAMKCGVPSIASDIPGNREVGLAPSSYFPVGDTDALAALLRQYSTTAGLRRELAPRYRELVKRYDWDVIAASTMTVMLRAAGNEGALQAGHAA